MALIILFDITTEAVLNMCNAGLHHYTAQKYSKVNFKDNKQNFKKSWISHVKILFIYLFFLFCKYL